MHPVFVVSLVVSLDISSMTQGNRARPHGFMSKDGLCVYIERCNRSTYSCGDWEFFFKPLVSGLLCPIGLSSMLIGGSSPRTVAKT